MPRVFLRPAARADLQDIARYTETTWGRRQRDVYLTAIDAKLGALAANPKIGKPRDAVRADGIEVVRVLHQRMDLQRQLASEGDD